MTATSAISRIAFFLLRTRQWVCKWKILFCTTHLCEACPWGHNGCESFAWFCSDPRVSASVVSCTQSSICRGCACLTLFDLVCRQGFVSGAGSKLYLARWPQSWRPVRREHKVAVCLFRSRRRLSSLTPHILSPSSCFPTRQFADKSSAFWAASAFLAYYFWYSSFRWSASSFSACVVPSCLVFVSIYLLQFHMRV